MHPRIVREGAPSPTGEGLGKAVTTQHGPRKLNPIERTGYTFGGKP